MTSAVVDALLEVAPLFDGFTPDDRADLLEVALEETYAAGLEIISIGQPARSMYVVGEGTVEVIEAGDWDEAPPLATLIPPCSFGEMAFFECTDHQIAVRTLTPVRVLSIERVGFDKLLKAQSLAAYKVALNVLVKLGSQIRELESWIGEELHHKPGVTRDQWKEFRKRLYQGTEI
jgi:CRP-like cAMP-binding protein